MSVAGSVEPSRSSPDAFTLENEQKDEKKQQPGGSLMPARGINSLQRGPSHDNIDISYHRVHLSSHFLLTIEAIPSCIFSNVNANARYSFQEIYLHIGTFFSSSSALLACFSLACIGWQVTFSLYILTLIAT